MQTIFKLMDIHDLHTITKETDSSFLLLLQHAVLLGLKEVDMLNELQYRYAEESLLQEHRAFLKAKQIKET